MRRSHVISPHVMLSHMGHGSVWFRFVLINAILLIAGVVGFSAVESGLEPGMPAVPAMVMGVASPHLISPINITAPPKPPPTPLVDITTLTPASTPTPEITPEIPTPTPIPPPPPTPVIIPPPPVVTAASIIPPPAPIVPDASDLPAGIHVSAAVWASTGKWFSLLVQYSWDLTEVLLVIYCESGGRWDAVSSTGCVGLFQICSGNNSPYYDPVTNVAAAWGKYQDGVRTGNRWYHWNQFGSCGHFY